MSLDEYKQKIKAVIETYRGLNQEECSLLFQVCEAQLKLIDALITISDYVGDHAQIVAQEALGELTKEMKNEKPKYYNAEESWKIFKKIHADAYDKKEGNLYELTNWHKWFAWHPVRTTCGKLVWLIYVDRCLDDYRLIK